MPKVARNSASSMEVRNRDFHVDSAFDYLLMSLPQCIWLLFMYWHCNSPFSYATNTMLLCYSLPCSDLVLSEMACNILCYSSTYTWNDHCILLNFIKFLCWLFFCPILLSYSTLLYSTLLYSTLLYSTLLYSTLLYPPPNNTLHVPPYHVKSMIYYDFSLLLSLFLKCHLSTEITASSSFPCLKCFFS